MRIVIDVDSVAHFRREFPDEYTKWASSHEVLNRCDAIEWDGEGFPLCHVFMDGRTVTALEWDGEGSPLCHVIMDGRMRTAPRWERHAVPVPKFAREVLAQ